MSHEVYVAKDLYGNYLYIGSGKDGRHKHCQSGVSHCYDLNKLHHTKVKYSVEVIHTNLSKEESLEVESRLITKHATRFNKRGNCNGISKDEDNQFLLEYCLENNTKVSTNDITDLLLGYSDEPSMLELISDYMEMNEQ